MPFVELLPPAKKTKAQKGNIAFKTRKNGDTARVNFAPDLAQRYGLTAGMCVRVLIDADAPTRTLRISVAGTGAFELKRGPKEGHGLHVTIGRGSFPVLEKRVMVEAIEGKDHFDAFLPDAWQAPKTKVTLNPNYVAEHVAHQKQVVELPKVAKPKPNGGTALAPRDASGRPILR
jgi:hypothetical protein